MCKVWKNHYIFGDQSRCSIHGRGFYHDCHLVPQRFSYKENSLILIHIFVVGCTAFKFEVIVGRNNVFNLLCRILPAKVTWPRNPPSRHPSIPISISEATFTIFPLRRSKGGEIWVFPSPEIAQTDRQTDRQTDSTHDGVDLTGNHRGPFVRDGPTACLCIPYSDTQHTLCSTASFLISWVFRTFVKSEKIWRVQAVENVRENSTHSQTNNLEKQLL